MVFFPLTVESYGIGNFVALPKSCKFGIVKAGGVYQISVALTNVGIDATRFNVRHKAKEVITVEHKAGLVAPGMTVNLKVRLEAPANDSEINEIIEIATESDILKLEMKASVVASDVDYNSRQPKPAANVTTISEI
jgi:Flagellar-associated PapD-like